MTSEDLTTWLRSLAKEIKASQSAFAANKVPGCPVPFFGNVLEARILTIGVNPSEKEFVPGRRWSEAGTIVKWQNRMLNYFCQEEFPAHGWFETWSIILELLGVSYTNRAAHIDVSPRPTTAMLGQKTDKAIFRAMVEHDAKWFFDLLGKLPQIELLLVAGPIPIANGSKQQLADFLRVNAKAHGAEWQSGKPLPVLKIRGRPKGIPVFVCPYEPTVDGRYAMIRHAYRHRDALRQIAPTADKTIPIAPARLDWPSMIGNFLLNYGTLDYLVFVFLKDHLSTREFATGREWHFKDRMERIAQHLKDAKYSAKQQSAFAELAKRLEPIRELRNHVAHGHMYLRMESGQPTITVFKAKDLDSGFLPGSKHVKFSELLEAASELTAIIDEFQLLTGFRTTE